MKGELFVFKRFSVSHSRSAMKVGVDGVLIGAWATPNEVRILDVGTGCGLISLIMAQRTKKASIIGIDIDAPSVDEAKDNFRNSLWSDRLVAMRESFAERISSEPGSFDLILSNPPFFKSGIKDTGSPRIKARHQGELSPFSLIEGSAELLKTEGRLSMICPAEFENELISDAISKGLIPCRLTLVRHHDGAPFKRLLIEFIKKNELNSMTDKDNILPETNFLTLFENSGDPTDPYLELCRDFYLSF